MADQPTPLQDTDLEMLEQRVQTSRRRVEAQLVITDKMCEALNDEYKELARRREMLDRDIRILETVKRANAKPKQAFGRPPGTHTNGY